MTADEMPNNGARGKLDPTLQRAIARVPHGARCRDHRLDAEQPGA